MSSARRMRCAAWQLAVLVARGSGRRADAAPKAERAEPQRGCLAERLSDGAAVGVGVGAMVKTAKLMRIRLVITKLVTIRQHHRQMAKIRPQPAPA